MRDIMKIIKSNHDGISHKIEVEKSILFFRYKVSYIKRGETIMRMDDNGEYYNVGIGEWLSIIDIFRILDK